MLRVFRRLMKRFNHMRKANVRHERTLSEWMAELGYPVESSRVTTVTPVSIETDYESDF